MKKILLYQHQSSYNHGCEALVYSISQQIKQVVPDSELRVCSFFKSHDDEYDFPYVDSFVDNKMWLQRYSLPWLIHQLDKRTLNSKWLQEKIMFCKPCYQQAQWADICIAIGGDTYCYNKGKEHWPLERKIKKLGKKMMLWGCSIEPGDIPGEMKEHLDLFDIITARDPFTYDALVANKIKAHIVRCADPAFLLEPCPCELPSAWDAGNTIGLNFSPMVMGQLKNKTAAREGFETLIKHILETGSEKIALISHVRLPFSDDSTELLPLYERYKSTGRVMLIDDISLNARQLKYIISQCKLFIGARTHATIAAYSTGVPTLAIGYSIKARGIAQDLFGTEEGMTVPIKSLSDGKSLISAYDALIGNREKIKQQLNNIMPMYKQKALISSHALLKLI